MLLNHFSSQPHDTHKYLIVPIRKFLNHSRPKEKWNFQPWSPTLGRRECLLLLHGRVRRNCPPPRSPWKETEAVHVTSMHPSIARTSPEYHPSRHGKAADMQTRTDRLRGMGVAPHGQRGCEIWPTFSRPRAERHKHWKGRASSMKTHRHEYGASRPQVQVTSVRAWPSLEEMRSRAQARDVAQHGEIGLNPEADAQADPTPRPPPEGALPRQPPQLPALRSFPDSLRLGSFLNIILNYSEKLPAFASISGCWLFLLRSSWRRSI